ncbi:MAG TPA: hypothetical protein DGT23_08495 [Micromonosporaceae bacterium]|nr:hypothetical protein [Micromonosporaceae bacterium]
MYDVPLADLRRLSGQDACHTVGAYGGDPCEDDPADLDFPVFVASARVVKERLEALGYGETLVRRLYSLLLSDGASGLYEVKEPGPYGHDEPGIPLTLEDWPATR